MRGEPSANLDTSGNSPLYAKYAEKETASIQSIADGKHKHSIQIMVESDCIILRSISYRTGMPCAGGDPHPQGVSPQPLSDGGGGGRQRANLSAGHGRHPQVLPGVCGESGLHEQPDVRRRSHGVSM